MTNTETPASTPTLADRLKNYGGSVSAATRYVVSFASGAAVMVGVLGFNAMSTSHVDQLFEAFKQLGEGLSAVITALGTIAGIATAVYGAWKATRAQQAKTVASTPGVQIHVDTSAASKAPEAVKALAENRSDPKATDIVPMTGGPVDTVAAKAGG